MRLNGHVFRLAGSPIPHALLRENDNWGILEADLVPPPARFWGDQPSPPFTPEIGRDARQLKAVPSPVDLLQSLPEGENWMAMSRRSLARLTAWFLIAEDPQRRLDAQQIVTLAHQASLVRHLVSEAKLERVLIADEVGLGKTIEA